MSLVEESLRLTPEERLERHQRALNTLLDLMEAKTVHAAG
jgi:acid stress-induced BolA-like protein IbaG/YrbA